MRKELMVLITVLTISAMLSGCITKPEDKLLPANYNKITINTIGNQGPILADQDFPNFRTIERVLFVSPENISLTLESESSHRTGVINATDKVPIGYRIYGGSEAYNLSNRYLLLQYKVFDSNDSLNESMNLTVDNYIKGGFESKVLNNASYKARVFAFERNVTNDTKANIIVVLFGYDNILGKIGVQDTKDISLNESLKILDIAIDRIKINTRQVVKMDLSSHINATTGN